MMDKIKDAIANFREKLNSISLPKSRADFGSLAEGGNLIIYLLVLLMIFAIYFLYSTYQDYKFQSLDNTILTYNNQVLKETKIEREEAREKFKKISTTLVDDRKTRLSDVVCFMEKYDTPIDYVNRQYKIESIDYDTDAGKFDVSLQGMKYYNDLPKTLILLKQYTNMIDLESFRIKLERELAGIGEISYYNVDLKGLIPDLTKPLRDIKQVKEENEDNIDEENEGE